MHKIGHNDNEVRPLAVSRPILNRSCPYKHQLLATLVCNQLHAMLNSQDIKSKQCCGLVSNFLHVAISCFGHHTPQLTRSHLVEVCLLYKRQHTTPALQSLQSSRQKGKSWVIFQDKKGKSWVSFCQLLHDIC